MRETLPAMFSARARALGDHPATRARDEGQWRDASYAEMERSIQATAQGLIALGLRAGERVGVMSWNRPEWSIVDFGILRAGGVVVPIYPTSVAEQVTHITRDAGLSILFVGGAQALGAVEEARGALPEPPRIITFDDEAADPARGLEPFSLWLEGAAALDNDAEVDRRQAAIAPDDLATIVYTSGTTGPSKGVMLSHAHLFHQFRALDARFEIGPEDRSLCFLPLSHMFERTWTYYVFRQGATNCYLRDPKQIMAALAEIQPTAMTGVPRLYEKIHAAMLDRVERARPARRWIFERALATGLEYHQRRLRGARRGLGLRLRYALADRLVLKKIRAVVGGPKRFFAAGGAALAREIEETFLSAGLLICQGYGLTETAPMLTCNCADELRLGTVGRPVADSELRIGEGGEIQARGPNVMMGYWGRPEETAACFTEDGWFKTGDVGVIDDDGFVRVTDRIKELIITSGGKNIAPAHIEMQVGKDHYIEQLAVIGDGRRFISALVCPSFDALEGWAAQQQIEFADRAELLRDRHVVEFIHARIQRQSAGLASFERIKRFHLLEEGFCQARGELTPTLKLKRQAIQRNYSDVIEALYQAP